MRVKSIWRSLAILVTLIIVFGCKKSSDETVSSGEGGAPAINKKRGAYFQTSFQDESQFIVETIVSDLAEQVFYAKYHRLPVAGEFSVRAVEKADSPSGAPAYELGIVFSKELALSLGVTIDGPIWSPEIYQEIVASLAKAVDLNAPAASGKDDASFLLTLTNGTAISIERANRKVSDAMKMDFSDPVLHEKAAALAGAFTLQEHSGSFFEIRSPLCRITAHLAFARFLSGTRPPGVNGRMAEAMLCSLMNNQAAALEKLKGIDAGNPGTDCWVRALNAYNTGDYRPIASIPNPSLLERVAWFRAFARSVDTDMAWSKLADGEKLVPDFCRIANAEGYSVQTGHELLGLSVPLELREIMTVYELSRGVKMAQKELVAQLNRTPERCFGADGHPRVIGWGQWAMFFQRHLCHAVQQNFDFMNDKWGVHDDAKEFASKCDELFGGLRLYPFVRRFNCTDVKSYHSAVDDGFRVTVAAPHLTPADCWNHLCYQVPFAALYAPNPNPHLNEWHKHNPPPGTAYDPLPRFNHPSMTSRPDVIAFVSRLHEAAPYDRDISYNLIKLEYNKRPTYDQAREVYQAVLPYATYAMAVVAQTVTDQPERFEALMVSASELDPARYFNLGHYFQIRGMDDKAAMYYEKGGESCQDRVLVASYAPWLVRYYLKKGDTQKARLVADEGGEVYSAAGLEAKAEFHEATGDYAQAFEWYRKYEERYDNSDSLIGFCMRYKAKTNDKKFDAELQKRTARLFPKGIEHASLKDFQSPPSDGVFVAEENNAVRSAGLKRGDVIVAVFGTRVHNFKQYASARDFDPNPELDLIVWQGDGYHQIKASPPNHRFGVNFVDYPVK